MYIDSEEIDALRRRLAETEAAMERIMDQIGTVADRLTPDFLLESDGITVREQSNSPSPLSVGN